MIKLTAIPIILTLFTANTSALNMSSHCRVVVEDSAHILDSFKAGVSAQDILLVYPVIPADTWSIKFILKSAMKYPDISISERSEDWFIECHKKGYIDKAGNYQFPY